MPVNTAPTRISLQVAPSRPVRAGAALSIVLSQLLLIGLLLADRSPEAPAESPGDDIAMIVSLLSAPAVTRALPAPVTPAPPVPPRIDLPELRLNIAMPDSAPPQRPDVAATTPPASGSLPAAAPRIVARIDCLPLRWLQSVSRRISHELKYPAQERRLKHRGTAYVRVSVNRAGVVLDAPLLRGSGYGALDLEAQAVFRRIGRFTPVPADACEGADIVVIDQPIVFGVTRF